MDRDNRYERVEKAYAALTYGEGLTAETAAEAMQNSYDQGVTDEFVVPTVVLTDGKPTAVIGENDSVIFYNFRPDRAREISRAYIFEDFDGFERKNGFFPVHYVSMTQYDKTFGDKLDVAFRPVSLDNTLGEYLAKQGKTQLRIAETEKYAHVTFFFNGGVEEPNENEDRILIASPKVATYDLQPEMSAYLVTERVLEEINSDKYDVIILNFANADMVGHTGDMDAAVAAIEALDKCVPQIAGAVLAKDGQILLTADHGNADNMLNEDGSIVTAHSLNDVPLLHIANDPKELKPGKLADLAPTLLELMDIDIPGEMTGESLVK